MAFRNTNRLLEILRFDEEQRRNRPLHAGGRIRSAAVKRPTRLSGQNSRIQISPGLALLGGPAWHPGIDLLPILVGERL